jgi:hypothetical protein
MAKFREMSRPIKTRRSTEIAVCWSIGGDKPKYHFVGGVCRASRRTTCREGFLPAYATDTVHVAHGRHNASSEDARIVAQK